MIYTIGQFTYIPSTCTHQIKLHDPWVRNILDDPYFACQIKITRPLGLHYNMYVSLARPLAMHYNLA